jgi:formylglycine-generating enzyme required for sulfatase activity
LNNFYYSDSGFIHHFRINNIREFFLIFSGNLVSFNSKYNYKLKNNIMKTGLLFLIFFVFSVNTFSNNIRVTNAVLTGQNMSNNTTYVQFDLAWDNSWRDNINWDAAWVFIKFKTTYDTAWRTPFITNLGHSVPSGFVYETPSPVTGLLIYRDADGSGNVSLSGVKVLWRYGMDNVADADIVSIKVFAFEMVYVPQGQFWVGDGSTTYGNNGQFSAGSTTNPFLISSENQLTLGGTLTSSLGNRNASVMSTPDDFNNGTTKTLPAAYPKGFNPFYCMKHEVSQGQYTEFLNSLTRWQQKNRVAADISKDTINSFYVMTDTNIIYYRNVIRCPQYGNGTTAPVVFSCTRPDRACNNVNWGDLCAFLDWAGLRPMTDLEYEKACRGPLTPVIDEYAWGNATYKRANSFYSSPENGTEYISPIDTANILYGNIVLSNGDGGTGPVRCGIFARTGTDRIKAGATYYGILDMCGNVHELTTSVGSTQGRVFIGTHGDGILSVNGCGNNSDWPGYIVNEITLGYFSRKGAGFSSDGIQRVRISDRFLGNMVNATRYFQHGIRGVLTSPSTTIKGNKN